MRMRFISTYGYRVYIIYGARDRLRLEWSERKGLRADGGTENKDRYTTQLVVRGPSYQLLEDVTANYHQ